MTSARKLPALDPDNRAFWTGGESGKLRICHCTDCGNYQHPPLPVCPRCGSDAIDFPAVCGDGVVVSYSINWQPWAPGQEVPFALAVVELAEQAGLWLMTNVVGCDVDRVHIDMPVTVDFIQQADVWLPVFTPREAA
jgi:uncharacterized OB-fold protein